MEHVTFRYNTKDVIKGAAGIKNKRKNIIIIIILAAVIISLLSVVFIYYKKVENSLKDNSVVAKGRNVDYKALDDDVDYNDEKWDKFLNQLSITDME